MTTMDDIHRIRVMFFEQGKNITQISSETGLDWKTVRKYVDMEDFNTPPPKAEAPRESKLDPFKPIIDGWLTEDLKAPRKQRHTAKRIFRRLQDEVPGFNCGYRTVATYVAARKKELQMGKQGGHLPLVHHPGEAQADFGQAAFYENEKYHPEGKYLVLSFPVSNGGYLQLNYGENMECLLEGLTTMFEYIGGVPTEIWFDNTSTIVTGIIKGGGRNITERFQRFIEHYRFKPVFMNPDSGWEKGNVENKVGYLRRNELVPVPRFGSLEAFNADLLPACDADMEREHYEDDRGRYISELFLDDRKALLPLPSVPFDTAGYLTVQTDNYGKFTLDKGKHRYSVSPDYSLDTVRIKLTSSEVIVMNTDEHVIVRHRRLYGDERESMDWVPYLKYISSKPRSLRNSGIYEMMPEIMQRYMDRCENSERGRILKILAELTDRSGFESALSTVEEAIQYNATDPDSLMNLYRRTYADVPLLPPLDRDSGIPKQKVIPFHNDLADLDAALKKGGAANG